MITTTETPVISKRNDDGTWQDWDVTITSFEFAAEDGADADTLTEWLKEFVAEDGEGEWSASYNGIESAVVCTGPTVDDVKRIAEDAAGVDSVELLADDCGYLNLVGVTLADGSLMVIGPESEGGYTWSLYSAQDYNGQPLDERYLTTDGDSTIGTLADAIRKAQS